MESLTEWFDKTIEGFGDYVIETLTNDGENNLQETVDNVYWSMPPDLDNELSLVYTKDEIRKMIAKLVIKQFIKYRYEY